jgi:hypothetical protein
MTKHSPLMVLALAGATAAACSELNTPLYFAGDMIESMGNDEVFPTSGMALRFRAPTEPERMRLAMQRDAAGYDMDIPWVSRDKVHIEITYRVTNLSNEAGAFALIVDGANEYTHYDTQAVAEAIGGDDPIILPLITTVAIMVEPNATYSGIVREDDFAEGELDLDALGRWNDTDVASPTFAGVLINRSDVNPIGMNLVPPNLVVPAMVQIDVRLRSTVRMRCEYYVRVRDDDDRLWHNDADDVYQPSPTLFQPPALMLN